MLPATAGLVLLFVGPVLAILVLSFTDWQLGARNFHWIGFENFVELGRDPVLLKTAMNTAIFALAVTPTTLVLAFIVALAIQSGSSLRAFYRTIHFLPYMATLAAMAIVWESLLHPTIGLVNHLLQNVGLSGLNWLRDPHSVLFTLAAIEVWRGLGYAMVLFLAGLNTIEPELYEAAALDGADGWLDRLVLVTLPQIAPISLFVAVITMLRALTGFTLVAVLTQGGPDHASEVILYRLYSETFDYFRAGYGAAIATVFLLVVGSLTAVQVTLGHLRERRS